MSNTKNSCSFFQDFMASAQRSLIAGSEETSIGVALCLSIPCCKIGILQRTTSTTALRGAATSLELAERRRGSILSMRFLLCTARRSVMVWRPEITAGGCIFLNFLRLTPKRGEGKQRNIIDRVGGLGGGHTYPQSGGCPNLQFPVAKSGYSGSAKWQSKWQTPD